MENKHCPICPRCCDLSKPHCPRGITYAKTGQIPASHEHHKNRLRFDKREHQLIMKYLHHAVRVVDSGKIAQDMTKHMFDTLSDEEVTQLAEMLEKLSDAWIELVRD